MDKGDSVPKEELPIEVGNLDGVHVDDIDVLEARQSQVLEQFAAQPTSPHHQHPHKLPDLFPQLWKQALIREIHQQNIDYGKKAPR